MPYITQQVLKGSIKNISECRHSGEVQFSAQKWGLAGNDELQLPVSGGSVSQNQMDN